MQSSPSDHTDVEDDAAEMAAIERLGNIQDAKRFRSSWCIDDVTDMQTLSMPHPFTDAHTLTYTTLRYGDHPAITVTTPIKGDRWMDLWNAAERIVKKSGEIDHTFVEDFNQTDKPGVLIVRLGS